MKPRLAQVQAGTAVGQVATTALVSGVLTAVWQAPATATSPLLSDSDSSALLSEDGTDWLFPG